MSPEMSILFWVWGDVNAGIRTLRKFQPNKFLLQDHTLAMSLQIKPHHFYKCAATHPPSVNLPSPTGARPALGEPIGVSNETSYYHNGKPAKPLSCYVAQYDPTTKKAVVFLGTEHPVQLHRFLPVYQGLDENVTGHLTTSPPYRMPRGFYLNFTQPLEVYLYALQSESTLNSFEIILATDKSILAGPPSTIPIRLYEGGEFSLDLPSRRIFWQAHRSYHYERLRRPEESKLEYDGDELDDGNDDDVDGKDGSVPDKSQSAKGGTRSGGHSGPSTGNRRGNHSGGKGVKGIDYTSGTECCDDLEWDDKDSSVPDKSQSAKGGTRSEGHSGPSTGNRPGNHSGVKGVRGIDYPVGAECCDDLEWDDEDFNPLRPIIRPPYDMYIAGVTHSLGAENCDDLEWDDEEYQVDSKRAEPVFSLALGKHQREGMPIEAIWSSAEWAQSQRAHSAFLG
ncbi:hypothetical protein DFS34DRAFT_694582, partial [Phlyctochytrium arcticum]